MDLIDDLDTTTGDITYTKPINGLLYYSICRAPSLNFYLYIDAPCATWTGCWASLVDDMVLMACVAINGYHSVVSYSWVCNGYICRGEDTPLLYTFRKGNYSCTEELGINICCEFCVKSKLTQYL